MKTSFQNIMATLEVETKNLSTNIENKKDQLKNLCAVFFAKIDNQISENQAIVSNIQKEFNRIEAMYVNPEKAVDAKIFSLTQEQQANELLRET